MYDNTVIGGVCSVCNKYFKNNTRRINIALDLENNKLVCKLCAILKAWKDK